ncbi:DUF4192 domain-containing protein [Mycolicibacterium rufum]|uniref:DUF4192 domain-containing protein n=1 Tax=Mycolicibacterium rufum TaxID=318424 RepID=A0ABY3UNM3_9MYCO|nr:DUF4192 domain-containing protein [Mycolicibacterium rufum]KGI67902.1 hypothetical protein EU78_11085 [Mycolicibacterium rufum]ULP38887.1 DUF4192 domain-containing protein [Mycolicibacterium rufum]
MASTPHPASPLDRPGDLIAALPAVLGFVPEKSLVVVTAADDEMGAILRSDLSEPRVPQLAELAASAGAEAVIAVIVDDEGAGCPMCADEHRELAHALSVELARWGVELLAAHVVDAVAAGGTWVCADGCGASGQVEDPTASPVAAAAVLDGRRLYGRRDELVEVVAEADPQRGAALAQAIEQAGPLASDRPGAAARSDIEHAMACAEQLAAGGQLDDEQTVRLARSLTDPRVRDTLYALAVGDRAGIAESLWADMSRRLPAPWRAEALVLLAFSAYARGDGPLAGISLDAALTCAPPHRMAGMLDQALQSGMRPEQIRELARTGYRLASQLGVRLPPRQAFGRRAG